MYLGALIPLFMFTKNLNFLAETKQYYQHSILQMTYNPTAHFVDILTPAGRDTIKIKDM